MDPEMNLGKRMLSSMEPTSSPSRKRARLPPIKPTKPTLRVDCTVAPQRRKPQLFVSPLSFTVESSTTFTSATQSGHTSARFCQDQFSSQVYDCHQTYNHQSQSYAQPSNKSPAPMYWPGFSGYQPAWTPTRREPYGCYSFADMCQTSVPCSIYSAFSNGNGNAGNVASAERKDRPTVPPNQSGDTRSAFVDALESLLLRFQETLLAEKGSIDEMLDLVALLRNQQ